MNEWCGWRSWVWCFGWCFDGEDGWVENRIEKNSHKWEELRGMLVSFFQIKIYLFYWIFYEWLIILYVGIEFGWKKEGSNEKAVREFKHISIIKSEILEWNKIRKCVHNLRCSEIIIDFSIIIRHILTDVQYNPFSKLLTIRFIR